VASESWASYQAGWTQGPQRRRRNGVPVADFSHSEHFCRGNFCSHRFSVWPGWLRGAREKSRPGKRCCKVVKSLSRLSTWRLKDGVAPVGNRHSGGVGIDEVADLGEDLLLGHAARVEESGVAWRFVPVENCRADAEGEAVKNELRWRDGVQGKC